MNVRNTLRASVLVPIRNERDFIERSLGAVLVQDYPPDLFEVVVVDGMSDDGTRDIVERLIATESKVSVRLVDNPNRIVATALNIGTKEATGDVLLRVDGHCEIGPGHLGRCVELLTRGSETPAGVGGPVETVSDTLVGRAIAASMGSRFGVGGSAFRVGVKEARFTDTVPFPAYTRATIQATGPYDEELVRNQDDEYNYRIRGLGGRLLLDPDLRSRYYSRASLGKLWRQYFQYGFWKVRVLQKHPGQMSFRQFVPPVLVLALLMWVVLGLAVTGSPGLSAIFPLLYLAGVLIGSTVVSAKQGLDLLPVLPIAFLALHLGYGSGFLVGLIRFWNRWGDSSTQVGDRKLFVGRESEGRE